MAERENERAFEGTRLATSEFMFGVLREDIGQLRADIARLADRQDAQFKTLLERQDQMFNRLDEKIEAKIDRLYHVIIATLVATLGTLATALISLWH